ncbi:arginine rich protein [Apiospora arundinis]
MFCSSNTQLLKYMVILGVVTITLLEIVVYKRAGQVSTLTTSAFPWSSNKQSTSTTKGAAHEPKVDSPHPIIDLIKEGHEKFARLQEARSHTLEEAAARYRDRRGRHPPPGFGDWFKAAKQKDAIIVEEFFDRIYHDLNPFWALDQLELRRRAHAQPEVIRIRNGKVTFFSEDPERGNRWMQIWTKLVKEIGRLPDLDMPINVMDETRVLVSWEQINEYMGRERRTRQIFPASEAVSTYTGYADLDSHPVPYDPHWISGEAHKYWDHVRATCPPNSKSRNISSRPSFSGLVNETYPKKPGEEYTYKGFVQNFTASQDACLQPHLRGLHATFVESISMSTTHELLPIFGGSKLPQNNEIVIPGAVYLADDKRYSGGKGIGGRWEGKMEGFMWRGVASGGRNKADNWWKFHRHRWAQMMNGTTLQKVLAGSEAAAPTFTLLPPSVYNLSSQRNGFMGSWLALHADVGVVDLMCSPGEVDSRNKRLPTCSYSSPFIGVVKPKPMKEQYNYKYLPDIDGNSFSGRWRGFLRSTSCPLKATVYTEWHDDRLVPWVHFVPFDNTFMDIYAIMAFFLGGHDVQGRQIAEESSRWASQVLRRDDMLLTTDTITMSDIYCSLCGVQVDVHDGSPVAHELLWNSSVRAIRARAYVHDPYVTGLGYLNADRQICADADESVSWQDPAAHLVVNDLFNGGFQPYFCFTMHDFCWRLLRHAVDPEKSFPTKTVARQLFAILYNTPAEPSGALLPGHDYGGASGFHVQGGMQDPVTAIYGSDLFYILQDPDDEFDFDAEITTDLLPNNHDMRLQGVESRETDLFSRLPSEIIMLVVSKLPSKTVCDLRLASKHVAAYTTQPLLPQSFWASRFDDGAEMAFAFSLRENHLPLSPIDWRQLYQRAQSMHKDFRTYPGFMNRWRIWKCIQQITPALALRLQNMESVARSPYLGRHPQIPEGFSPLGNISSHVTFEFGASQLNTPSTTHKLVAGSRLFEKHYLGIPDLAGSQPFRLGVSFISLVDTHYICGLRVLTTREDGQGSELSRAGFVNPTNEQIVELGSLEDIDAISFQITILGIIGLSFQTRIMESPRSHIIGQFGDRAGVDNGVSQLKVGRRLRGIGFLIGLDACKIVSLELFGRQSADELLCSTPAVEGPAEIWTPASPGIRVEWQHIYPSTQQTFNLCSAMDFGGEEGRLLELLTQVNVFMGTFPEVFLGMSFVYADGTERAFGRKPDTMWNGRKYPCIVQSFPLSGPEGERICQADTSYMPSHDTIQRLSLSTTAGRSIAFGLHGEHLPQSEGICTNRRAPPGKVFTSFFSLHSSPVGHFRDFSALDISADQTNKSLSTGDIAFSKNPWDVIITSMLYSAKELLAHSGGFAFTSASLCGLRRIRFSVGAAGYSRGSHRISGLRLEYKGSASPAVVGQWISEYGKSLKISDDERLTEVVTFHHASNRFSRVKFGPMSGMSITTSKGRAMDVMPLPAEGDVRLCFRETPYETLDAVAWGCNYKWDHVRVTMKSRNQTEAAHRELLFGPVNRPVPGWAVRDQVFLQEKTADGDSDPLKSIQMTFKWMTSEPAALSFIYRSGRVLSLGTPGGKPVTETLDDNERLTRMDIGIFRNNRTPSIEFKTSQKRTLRFPYPGTSQPLKVQRWEMHILQHDADSKGEDGAEPGVVHDIPGGMTSRVVGFWAIPRRVDRTLQFPSFGPIYEQLSGGSQDS